MLSTACKGSKIQNMTKECMINLCVAISYLTFTTSEKIQLQRAAL